MPVSILPSVPKALADRQSLVFAPATPADAKRPRFGTAAPERGHIVLSLRVEWGYWQAHSLRRPTDHIQAAAFALAVGSKMS